MRSSARKIKYTQETLAKLHTVDFWKALNPDLTISDFPFRQVSTLSVPSVESDKALQQMRLDGYFELNSVLSRVDCGRLAAAINRLDEQGFPPFFAYVYDEFWQAFKSIAPVITPMLGENYCILDNQMAWYIRPSDTEGGFAPHRDGAGIDYDNLPRNSPIHRDGLPWFATIWIALTDVSTSNFCMYVCITKQ